MKAWARVLGRDMTKEQSKDTGMAIVLILLLLGLTRQRNVYMIAAIVVHVLNMIVPQLFRPAAAIWFGFSHLLGLVTSRIVLTVVFFVVVTPIGLWRRMTRKDSLQLKDFKVSRHSVMFQRNHTFVGNDLDQPF